MDDSSSLLLVSFSLTPERSLLTSSRSTFSSFASDLLKVEVDAIGAGAGAGAAGAASIGV